MTASHGRQQARHPAPPPEPEPEPAAPKPVPETVKVRMHNATHGARHPGAVITLPAAQARELIRQGLASRA